MKMQHFTFHFNTCGLLLLKDLLLYSLKHTLKVLKCTDYVDRAYMHAFLCITVDEYDVELLVNSNIHLYVLKSFNSKLFF